MKLIEAVDQKNVKKKSFYTKMRQTPRLLHSDGWMILVWRSLVRSESRQENAK